LNGAAHADTKVLRVLVLSASLGAGHDGAARELVRRLEAVGHRATISDVLGAAPRGVGSFMRSSYEMQLRRTPWTYQASYQTWYLVPWLCRPLEVLLSALTRSRILEWIGGEQPDVVVSTHPIATQVLGRLRERGILGVPVVTLVTDFAVHPVWVHPYVDLNLCVHPDAAAMAAKRSGRAAMAPGPLVGQAFRSGLPDPVKARRALGLPDDRRAVLVVAGSWGVGNVERTFDALVVSGRYTPIVVCGTNDRLRRRLEAKGHGRVFGWTDQMPMLMAAADALVENAGGLTCMEAFAAGLPVVNFLPIAGHGRENAAAMARAGVVAACRTAGDLIPALDRVTGPAGEASIAAAKAMFSGDAASDVAALAGPRPRLVETSAACTNGGSEHPSGGRAGREAADGNRGSQHRPLGSAGNGSE